MWFNLLYCEISKNSKEHFPTIFSIISTFCSMFELMKKSIIKAFSFFLLLLTTELLFGQVVDTLQYDITVDYLKLKDSLLLNYQKKGYINAQIETDTLNKQLYIYMYEKINVIEIDENNETYYIKFDDYDNHLYNRKQKLKNQGIMFGDFNPMMLKTSNDTLFMSLTTKKENKRIITGIVFEEQQSFPNNFKKRLKKDFIGFPVTEQNLKRINNFTQSMGFVSPSKFPEVLFTTDSTKVYVYTIKNKQNQAEGLVGFTNDDNDQLKWNGFLDIALINTLKQGETIHLDWNNNGFDQSHLQLKFELPYIAGSKFGLESQLNIFRQDSTFQTTNFDLKASYLLSFESRINIGLESIESSNIQNLQSATLDDFEANFYNISYTFEYRREPVPRLLPKKYFLNVLYGFGKRESNSEAITQQKIELTAAYRYDIDQRNSFYVKNHTRFLRSDAYLINELYRFGGVHNMRGFVDNFLQANLYSTINTEYQFKLGSNFYAHSVIDYGYFEDATTQLKGNLKSFGFGFGLLNNNSLFKFMIANGTTGQENFSFQNSIVHLSFRSFF